MKFKRTLAALLIPVLSVTLFAGCAKNETAIITVGDKQVSAADINFYYKSQVKNYEKTYGDYSKLKDYKVGDKTFDQSLRENVVNQAIGSKILEILFDEAGLKITNEDKATMEKDLSSYKNSLGSAGAYDQNLKDLGITDTQFKKIFETQTFYKKYTDYLFGENGKQKIDEQSIKDDLGANYVRVKQILVKYTDDKNEALTGEALAKAKAKYAEVKAKVDAGGDFEALMKEYNEDPGMNSDDNNQGYIFNKDESFMQEFKDKSFELKVGQIGVTQTSYGMHIIKKYPSNDDITFEKKGKSMLEDKQASVIDELINNKRKELEAANKIVKNDEALKKLGFEQTAAADNSAANASGDTSANSGSTSGSSENNASNTSGSADKK